MDVECYICDQPFDIETKLVSHLRSHTELEGQIASQKARKARLEANKDKVAYAEEAAPEALKTKPKKSKKESQKGTTPESLTPPTEPV
jgi:hypothetical protein